LVPTGVDVAEGRCLGVHQPLRLLHQRQQPHTEDSGAEGLLGERGISVNHQRVSHMWRDFDMRCTAPQLSTGPNGRPYQRAGFCGQVRRGAFAARGAARLPGAIARAHEQSLGAKDRCPLLWMWQEGDAWACVDLCVYYTSGSNPTP
jgi:hypothetical protein